MEQPTVSKLASLSKLASFIASSELSIRELNNGIIQIVCRALGIEGGEAKLKNVVSNSANPKQLIGKAQHLAKILLLACGAVAFAPARAANISSVRLDQPYEQLEKTLEREVQKVWVDGFSGKKIVYATQPDSVRRVPRCMDSYVDRLRLRLSYLIGPAKRRAKCTSSRSDVAEGETSEQRRCEPAANATATASPPKRVSPLKRAHEDDDDASVDQLEPEKKRRPRATSKPLPPPSEDDWICPICLEVPRGQIHIKCSRGCIFCAECLEQASAVGDKCAMCREPSGRTRAGAHPIRNFPAERAIQDYRARFPGWGS